MGRTEGGNRAQLRVNEGASTSSESASQASTRAPQASTGIEDEPQTSTSRASEPQACPEDRPARTINNKIDGRVKQGMYF